MATSIQFGERQLTIDLIFEHLTTSSFLPQLLREMVVDKILADSQIQLDRSELETTCDRLAQALMYQGFDRSRLFPIANRTLKLQKIKQSGWGNKVYSYFLQRKNALDGVVYSIMQVHEPEIAQELLFRVQSGEYSFAELAFKYSQNDEARDGGKTSPLFVKDLAPELSKYMMNLEVGEVSQIFGFNNLYTFIRLEYFIPAQLDEKTTAFLVDELFNRWIEQQIAQRISSLTPAVKLITPEFEDDLLMTSIDCSSRTDSFDSAQQDWVGIELSPKPPQANLYPPKIGTNMESQPQSDRVALSSDREPMPTISNLGYLVFWLLSLAIIGSAVSIDWEYFKLKFNPIYSMLDHTRSDRATLIFLRSNHK